MLPPSNCWSSVIRRQSKPIWHPTSWRDVNGIFSCRRCPRNIVSAIGEHAAHEPTGQVLACCLMRANVTGASPKMPVAVLNVALMHAPSSSRRSRPAIASQRCHCLTLEPRGRFSSSPSNTLLLARSVSEACKLGDESHRFYTMRWDMVQSSSGSPGQSVRTREPDRRGHPATSSGAGIPTIKRTSLRHLDASCESITRVA